MRSLDEKVLPLRNLEGQVAGNILIAVLPSYRSLPIPPLVVDEKHEAGSCLAPVQLLESTEYRYTFELPATVNDVRTDRPEVFQADTLTGTSGRLRPGLYVGSLPVRVFSGNEEIGQFAFEVRSRKLDYLNDYQWMLRDIAEQMTEVVMNRFGVTEQRFSVDETRDANTLYQRFAFLRSLISGEAFQGSLQEILRRPHVDWIETREMARPGQGLHASSWAARELARPGPRARWPEGVIETVPIQLERCRTEVSVDSMPNRFVKFALESWRSAVEHISVILLEEARTEARERGLREVYETLDWLDAVLSEELFREVGRLEKLPVNNQVLQKREGYRDLYRAYIQFEMASVLSWQGGEDVYSAGQRNVAMLYEYWVFLQLATLVSELCEASFDFASLIEVQPGGLNVGLRAGRQRVLKGEVDRLGRKMTIELWFNRTFPESSAGEASWTREMRPDCSLRITPSGDELATFQPVWLHFDAKYRIKSVVEAFGESTEPRGDHDGSQVAKVIRAEALREDLLKMHAYRDAIRRSAGAYVLYPGTEEKKVFNEYHELLPGLGAFAFRPTESGEVEGARTVRAFIEDVVEHIASQLSQHERGRYWNAEVYSQRAHKSRSIPAAPFLSRPPADTLVLLGFVKSESHWQWIQTNKLYNLRADERRGSVRLNSKELSAELVVLYCPELDRIGLARIAGNPELKSSEQMRALGYPDPRRMYCCLTLAFLESLTWGGILSAKAVERLHDLKIPIHGAPAVVSWQELMACAPLP